MSSFDSPDNMSLCESVKEMAENISMWAEITRAPLEGTFGLPDYQSGALITGTIEFYVGTLGSSWRDVVHHSMEVAFPEYVGLSLTEMIAMEIRQQAIAKTIASDATFDLACVELFAGKQRLSQAFREKGFSVLSLDRKYADWEDVDTPSGLRFLIVCLRFLGIGKHSGLV